MQDDDGHNALTIGYLHEASFRFRAQAIGYEVFTTDFPYTRIDCILYKDQKMSRVQIKTATLKDGILYFRSCTKRRNIKTKKRSQDIFYTKAEIDYFGIYCPELNQHFLIPIEVCPPKQITRLVYEASKTPCIGCLLAADYSF